MTKPIESDPDYVRTMDHAIMHLLQSRNLDYLIKIELLLFQLCKSEWKSTLECESSTLDQAVWIAWLQFPICKESKSNKIITLPRTTKYLEALI